MTRPNRHRAHHCVRARLIDTGANGALPRRTASATAMAAALAVSFGVPVNAQQITLPTGGTVTSGNATITSGTSTLTVNQASQNAVINWMGFSIGAGGTVNFVQPGASSIALNRVTGGQASQIDGALNANGRVFLVNANGVLFGAGSQVNVGGIVASTLNITDSDFNAGIASGKYRFGDANGYGGAAVQNAGRIIVTGGGDAALIGNVSNAAGGSITADRGNIEIANAPQAVLDFIGDGLTRLVVSSNTLISALAVENAGTLQADGGTISLQGVNPGDYAQLVVNQSGSIRARTLDNVGGRIFLSGGPVTANSTAGQVVVSGTLDASATVAGQSGGKIAIDGESVTIGYNPTTINASGAGSGANGTLTISANSQIDIVGSTNIPDPQYGGSTSYIADAALASAASNGTDSFIASHPASLYGSDGYGGSIYLVDANIVTRQTRDALIQFDAGESVGIQNSQITANGAALNLNLDANTLNSTSSSTGSNIQINNSTLVTNGGSMQLYGQGDALNGRAGTPEQGSESYVSGVSIADSTIDTRNAAGDGTGAVTMRGIGTTHDGGGTGIAIGNSSILTGNGNISLDGIGGIGGVGVAIAGDPGEGSSLATLSSAHGNIMLTGTSTNQTDQNAYINASPIGVQLSYANIAAGGNVTISGTGGDLSPTIAYLETNSAGGNVSPGDGVQLQATAISAGAGKQVSITGASGSAGFVGNYDDGTNDTQYTESPAAAIRQTGDSATATGTFAGIANGAVMGIQAPGGTVLLDSAAGDISMEIGASTANTAGAGGSIQISGNTVHLLGTPTQAPVFDSSGSTGNGTVDVISNASIVLVAQADAANQPTGTTTGTARPEAVAGAVRTRGATPQAAASAGDTGYSYISDGAIDSALNGSRGTSITSTGGGIYIGPNVALLRSTGTAPALLFLATEATDVGFFGGLDPTGLDTHWSVGSTAAPLGLTVVSQASALIQNATINTNGGNVLVTAANGPVSSIDITASTLDTRVGQSATGSSGNITLSGTGGDIGIRTAGAQLLTSTGTISLSGHALNGGDGVALFTNGQYDSYGGSTVTPTLLQTGSGNIRITGIAENSVTPSPSYGVEISGATISAGGRVDVAGYNSGQGSASTQPPGSGVAILGSRMQGNPLPAAISGGTGVTITGTSVSTGPGIYIGDQSTIDSSGPVALRAQGGADGSAPVQLAGNAQVSSGTVVNLRPGNVDIAGTVSDDNTVPITIGTGSGSGYVLTTDLFAHLKAPTVVVGSSEQTGAITVNLPLTLANNLTLQNGSTGFASSGYGGSTTGGDGGVAIIAPVDIGDHVLGLVSSGDISQTAAVTAHSLLAVSSSGSVTLGNAGNTIQPNTLGGYAAGNFTYVNSAALSDGTVTASGIDPSGYATPLSASGVSAGGNLLLQTLAGNFTLNGAVSAAAVDIVTAGVFQDPNASAITAANGWRIWANTNSGEIRGGLAGTGPLPNLYGCRYNGSCGVMVPTTGNHFIYALQPTLDVTIDNQSRLYGAANPALTYSTSGLQANGDTLAGALSGQPFTTATITSLAGSYAINGNFLSSAGYRLAVTPGVLTVTSTTLPPPAPAPVFIADDRSLSLDGYVDYTRELPSTYLYDRNLGGAPPACSVSTVPGTDMASASSESLTRQWSLVRTRPNLSSCVQKDKKSACASEF